MDGRVIVHGLVGAVVGSLKDTKLFLKVYIKTSLSTISFVKSTFFIKRYSKAMNISVIACHRII